LAAIKEQKNNMIKTFRSFFMSRVNNSKYNIYHSTIETVIGYILILCVNV